MNGIEEFKKAIGDYLEKRGQEDELFAITLKKENKNLDSCIDYILNEVQKSGVGILSDGDTYKLAVHYYDEDDIKNEKFTGSIGVGVGSRTEITPKVKVELTAEEIQKAEEVGRQQAIAKAIQDKMQLSLTKAKKKKADPNQDSQELTLF